MVGKLFIVLVASVGISASFAEVILDDFNNAVPGQTALGQALGIAAHSGYWYGFSDAKDGGSSTITPDVVTAGPSFTHAVVPQGSDGSKCLHVTMNLKSTISYPYAAVGFQITTAALQWIDLTSMTSLTFRAKGSGTLRVKFMTDKVTNGYKPGRNWGDMGAEVSLTSAWKSYTIAAADIKPQPFSPQEADKLTWADCRDKVNKMHFQTAPSMTGGSYLDLYLDDLEMQGVTLQTFGGGSPVVNSMPARKTGHTDVAGTDPSAFGASNQASAAGAGAMTAIPGAPGQTLEYGVVTGATTISAAMSTILGNVQNTCGEKPQIGKVFRFKGINTIGVFFSVTNHPQGNTPEAGLVLSAASGPHQVEAALVSDNASRFGRTVNPMLQQLFGAWHPGSQTAASGAKTEAKSSSAGPAPVGKLHTVFASDNSASMSIADGWQLDPHSGGSTMILNGPSGELAIWGAVGNAVDPYNPQQVGAVRNGIYRGTQAILYPFPQDLEKAYPDLWQAWRRAINLPPAKLHVESIQPLQLDPQKGTGVFVTGHIDQEGQPKKKLVDIFCISPQSQWGAYTLHSFFNIMTDAQSEREQKTVMAMMQSVKVNQEVMSRQMQAMLAQKQANDHAIRQNAQVQIQNIRNIGAQATARFNATQAANAAQQAQWDAREDAQARNTQEFSNYLLDQTVVQDNNMYNNGTVGHGTVWNSTADALVKTDPDRFEYVDKPNFWQGTDYHK